MYYIHHSVVLVQDASGEPQQIDANTKAIKTRALTFTVALHIARGSLGLKATSESVAHKLTSVFTPETIKSAKLNRVQIQLETWEGWVVSSNGYNRGCNEGCWWIVMKLSIPKALNRTSIHYNQFHILVDRIYASMVLILDLISFQLFQKW